MKKTGGIVTGILLRWVIGVVSLGLTALLAQSLGIGIKLTGVLSTFIVVALMAVVNALIRPILLAFTLPLNCLTLGLFTLIVNALMFWLVGELGVGLEVKNFWAALFGSVVMSIISSIAYQLFGINKKD